MVNIRLGPDAILRGIVVELIKYFVKLKWQPPDLKREDNVEVP